MLLARRASKHKILYCPLIFSFAHLHKSGSQKTLSHSPAATESFNRWTDFYDFRCSHQRNVNKWNSHRFAYEERVYICCVLCLCLYRRLSLSYLGAKCVRLHLMKRKREYLFCYFTMVILTREQGKASPVIISYRILDRTSSYSYCFRSNF